MNEEDKIFKAIELLQERLKIITDLAVRGIFIHIAISAFSITFAFQSTTIPKTMIPIANIIITLLGFLSTIAITNDIKVIKSKLLVWHNKTGIGIEQNELSGILRAAFFYACFCLVLIIFWVFILIMHPK